MEKLIQLIEVLGFFSYILLFIIIFLESFPVTFFLPGDSLLFTTGFLASQGNFNIIVLVIVLYIASVLGYFFSYFMGERIRTFILNSNDRYWFKKKHLDYTKNFFDKYGDKTIIIGRFIPIVRSFGPTLAGAVDMNYKKFMRDNILGGLLWVPVVTSLGYFLGKSIPNAHLYLTPIILGIIFVSFIPTIIEYIHVRRKKHNQGA